jgi:hypothetical protein
MHLSRDPMFVMELPTNAMERAIREAVEHGLPPNVAVEKITEVTCRTAIEFVVELARRNPGAPKFNN